MEHLIISYICIIEKKIHSNLNNIKISRKNYILIEYNSHFATIIVIMCLLMVGNSLDVEMFTFGNIGFVMKNIDLLPLALK